MLVKNEKIVYNKEKYKNKYKNMAELVNKPKQKEILLNQDLVDKIKELRPFIKDIIEKDSSDNDVLTEVENELLNFINSYRVTSSLS